MAKVRAQITIWAEITDDEWEAMQDGLEAEMDELLEEDPTVLRTRVTLEVKEKKGWRKVAEAEANRNE